MSAVEVRLEGAAGEYMESATLVEWHACPGTEVVVGAVLGVVETTKAASEIAAPAAGRIAAVAFAPGDEVPVGAVLCTIEPMATAAGFVVASPIARRLAVEHGLDLGAIAPTGPGGCVVERDVRALLDTIPPASHHVVDPPRPDDLDPDLRRLFEQAGARGRPAVGSVSAQALRTWYATEFAPVWNRHPIPLARVEDVTLPGGAGPRPARLYDPGVPAPAPALLYLHGGGWVMGDLATHDGLCRRLAALARCRVLALDYRLAPEHPFPAAHDDATTALGFVLDHGPALGLDPARLAIGGDSAGANLALAATQARLDRGDALPRCLLLAYGAFARRLDTPSARRFGDGFYPLSLAGMAWFWDAYLAGNGRGDARAEPLLGRLEGLPELGIFACDQDLLLDESLDLAAKAEAAGVPHRLDVRPGLVHGCLQMADRVDAVAVMVERMARFLRDHLLERRR